MGAILGSGPALIGASIRYEKSKPSAAYLMDVNRDSRPDIVVRNKDGQNFIYLAQTDGTFKASEEAKKEQEKSIEEKLKELR